MTVIRGIDLGNLPQYLFFFENGSTDANWQGATKGFVGDVAVNGIVASERTSGTVPYAGTVFTNAATLGAWQNIVNALVNAGQAFSSTNQVALINGLQLDLVNAIQQINSLPATTGFTNRSSTSLNGLNTQNGVNELFVINITSGLNFSSKINITGDPGDVFVLRWDTDENPLNGYQGQVKPQSGGAIVPLGGLTPANFINVAGNINSSGGGSTPVLPYPQGPRFNNGQGSLINGGSDFNGGGYFTGYWLTTGTPTNLYTGPGADPLNPIFFGQTDPLSNGIFVGGWYTLTDKFSMTSGTSGVYVAPNPATIEQNIPAVTIEKDVSVDGGANFVPADNAPFPTLNLSQQANVFFRYTVTNTGNEDLVSVSVTDDVYGPIAIGGTLAVGQTAIFNSGPKPAGSVGFHTNIGTVNAIGEQSLTPVSDSNSATYQSVLQASSILLTKYVSPDNGATYFDANNPPGPSVIFPQNPLFRYVITNTGQDTLDNITLNDSDLGNIPVINTSLTPGATEVINNVPGTWALGQQGNVATATGTGQVSGLTVSSTNPARYFGVEEIPNPSILIEKLVSVDNGGTFVSSPTSPGPELPQGGTPQFQYIVTNNGNTPLQPVTVVDNIYGLIAVIPFMLPGDVQTITFVP